MLRKWSNAKNVFQEADGDQHNVFAWDHKTSVCVCVLMNTIMFLGVICTATVYSGPGKLSACYDRGWIKNEYLCAVFIYWYQPHVCAAGLKAAEVGMDEFLWTSFGPAGQILTSWYSRRAPESSHRHACLWLFSFSGTWRSSKSWSSVQILHRNRTFEMGKVFELWCNLLCKESKSKRVNCFLDIRSQY